MNASEIRQKFLDYQVNLGHKVIPPAPLVLENDPTTLFTGSGMQPLLPYLLGEEHPAGTRLTDSQPSMRMQDIEDVGDPRHTTVFEMLGNWSLGDYFKEEQIPAFFNFLVKEVGLNPEKIYVTCFIGSEKYGIPKDTESAAIWQRVFKQAGIDAKIAEIGSAAEGKKRGIRPGEHIFFYDDKENWWSRGGGIESTPIGDPCGPDSEVFYDFGEDKQDVKKFGQSHPASDGARFMEIGNQVFMQYRRKDDGTFTELSKKNVDFGGGLERIAAAAIDSFDVFQISLLRPIIDKLEQISGKSYDNNTDEMRIIADHLRGAYLLAAQGLIPANKQQGYVMRRLIRRAILKALDLEIAQNFLPEIVPLIAASYKDLPETILPHRNTALEVLTKEEQTFRKTLKRGLKELNRLAARVAAPANMDKDKAATPSEGSEQSFDPRVHVPDGQLAVREGAPRKDGRATGHPEDKDSVADRSAPLRQITGHDIFKLQDTYGFPSELSVEEFYKQGIDLSSTWKKEFESALEQQRRRSQTATKGMFKGGLEDHGETSTKYHTATHLTLAALQQLIDSAITQKGSNITPERMRLDFNLDHKLTPEEKQKIEDQVNAWIAADLPVSFAEYDKDYAKNELKAHGNFWEKYPAKVKVYTIGDNDAPVSREVCGGPHVSRTSELGHFKIKKEESSSAGIRRIKAVLE